MDHKTAIFPQQRTKHNQKRPGDWYCPVCGNFNFSFRVKCNRCVTQWRDDPSTQLFQKASEVPSQLELPSLQHQESASSDKSAGKSTHENSDEDDQETLTKYLAPFQQALFVHDLLSDEPPFQSLEFSFYRSCNSCGKTCYFYQQKCGGCNACQQ